MSQSEAMLWLVTEKLASDGESITYKRGGTSLALTAVLGRSEFRTTDGNGRSIMIRSDKDFLLQPGGIVVNGVVSAPVEGDRITFGSAVYEVAATIPGEQCWRSCDDYDHMIRIHTRKVTT